MPAYSDPKAALKFSDYKYCVNKSNDEDSIKMKTLDNRRLMAADLAFRRTTFILAEIVNDLGIKKSTIPY